MYNIVIYKPELKYQKNREQLFLLMEKYDKNHKYVYISIEKLEEDLNTNNNLDLKDLINLNSQNNINTSDNIHHIFYYPRQIKEIDPNKKIYDLILNNPFKKSIFIDDIHSIKFEINLLDKFDNKFMAYTNIFNIFFKNVNLKNVISCPHYLNDNFVYKSGNKDIKISILGHYLGDTYKIRKEIIKGVKNINSKLVNCSINTYGKLKNPEYYKILKESYASIATTGDHPDFYYPYIVSKYFEIPGSGGLLLAHILPEMENEFLKYGFIDGENYIKFRNVDELIEICNYAFNPINFEKIEKIRMNGYNLVKNNHLISHRIKMILNIINI